MWYGARADRQSPRGDGSANRSGQGPEKVGNVSKSKSKSLTSPSLAEVAKSAGLASPSPSPIAVHPSAVPTMERVLAFCEAFAKSVFDADSSAIDLASVLAARYPSKGVGKVRVPKSEAEPIMVAGRFEAVRLRGLLAFGDWLLAGNTGTETQFRKANAAANASKRGKSGKSKSGRKSKSKSKSPATPAAAADAILAILRGFKSPERVEILNMVREGLAAR